MSLIRTFCRVLSKSFSLKCTLHILSCSFGCHPSFLFAAPRHLPFKTSSSGNLQCYYIVNNYLEYLQNLWCLVASTAGDAARLFVGDFWDFARARCIYPGCSRRVPDSSPRGSFPSVVKMFVNHHIPTSGNGTVHLVISARPLGQLDPSTREIQLGLS